MSSSEEPSATSSWIGHARRECDIAHLLAAHAVHEQPLLVQAGRLDPLAYQGLLQLRSRRGANAHRSADAGGQLLQRGLDDELAAVDDQHLVDGLRDLREYVAGDQHGLLACCEVPEKVAQPAHSLRIEPVRRLVEDQQLGIAEQRGREPQPLPHPERVPLDASVGCAVELDQAQHLVHTRVRQADRSAQHPQVVAAGAARMEVRRLEHGSDSQRRMIERGIGLAEDQGAAAARLGEPEQHPQRRRLAGAVRAEEAGDRPRREDERERVDGEHRPEPLRQRVGDDRRHRGRGGHVKRQASPGISRVATSHMMNLSSVDERASGLRAERPRMQAPGACRLLSRRSGRSSPTRRTCRAPSPGRSPASPDTGPCRRG